MVGGGSRRGDDSVAISSTNVFSALGRKKKKPTDMKEKAKRKEEQEKEEVFWAPAPLTVKSWGDVDDEDDDDYYATTAPPQAVWAPAAAATGGDEKESHDEPPVEISVIQPVSGCGLAILSVFSHFYLKEIMNPIDWIGITLAGIGTIGVGAGGKEQEASSISIFQLPWLAVTVVVLFVLLNGWLRICKSERRQQEMMEYEVVEEVIYGLESGILFGMASVISKMGFVFLEQGFNSMVVPLCISISICFSGTGFLYQTRGLKHGRAIVVSTCAAVASIVTGVLAGMLALGERLPSTPSARLFLLLGWLLIMIGVILLACSSRLVHHLRWPLKHRGPTGLDRNFGHKRPISARTKDSNPPSAVIQAATLHHLISSQPKEKA